MTCEWPVNFLSSGKYTYRLLALTAVRIACAPVPVGGDSIVEYCDAWLLRRLTSFDFILWPQETNEVNNKFNESIGYNSNGGLFTCNRNCSHSNRGCRVARYSHLSGLSWTEGIVSGLVARFQMVMLLYRRP